MENKALGKGLSALIPEKINLNLETKNEGVHILKVADIKDSSLQPRTNYDEAKLEELKASIKEKGVLQPILVRQKGEGFEVVAGERRLRAVRSLHLEEIPAIIKKLTDQETLVIALIENIQRQELNPIEEAQAYQKLVEDFQYTQEEVAKSVGKDRSTVANMMRVLRLPEDMQKSIYDNEISFGHGRALLSVEDPAFRKQLFEKTLTKGWSVRELENKVRHSLSPKKQKAAGKTDHDITALEDDLQGRLATKVTILAKRKKGKIIIEYYSLEDLDRILKLIRR
jgi:ParB family transcriptional regulator, chromosome partitioning protein